MTRLLALDQSTRLTGWAFQEDDGPIEYGAIKTPSRIASGKGDMTAADFQLDEIYSLATKHSPDYVAIEEVHLGPNPRVLITLAEFRGRLIERIIDRTNCGPVIPVSSNDMKSYMHFGFKVGRELKKDRARFTATAIIKGETLAMSEPENWIGEDESDAICILMIAWSKVRIAELSS